MTSSERYLRFAVGGLFFATLSCGGSTEPVVSGKAGPPASLEIQAGQDQTAVVGTELTTPLKVRVLDASGNPVAGQIVNFKVTSGGGSVFAGAAITTAAGTAVERWTLGTIAADSQRVEARAVDQNTGAAIVFGTFRAVATHAAPAKIAKIAGDAQTGIAGAAATDSLAVLLADQYSNPISGATVTWAVSGGGSLATIPSQTNAQGIARVSWTLGTSTALAQQVTAAVDTITPAQFSATIGAATPAKLIIQTLAQTAVVGVPFGTAPVVRVADAFDNTVPSATTPITLSVNSGASVIGTATVNALNGVATFSTAGLTGTLNSYTLTYTGTIGGVVKTATQSISLVAGAAARYVVSAGNTSPAVGSTVTITAQLSDANGANITTANKVVTWSVTGARGSFASPTSTTNSSGTAIVVFTVDTLAGTTATVKATDDASLTGTVGINSVPAVAAKLAFLDQPPNAEWRITLVQPIRIAIKDSYGNTVTSSNEQVVLAVSSNSAGATLAGGSARATTSGVASFSGLLVDQAASSLTLRATSVSGNLTPATSNAFSVAAIGTIATFTKVNTYPVSGIAVSGSRVYVSEGSVGRFDSRVWSSPIDGNTNVSSTIDVANQQNENPTNLVIDGTYIDAFEFHSGRNSSNATVLRLPIAGGVSQTLSMPPITGVSLPDQTFGPQLIFDGTYLFTQFYMHENHVPASGSYSGFIRWQAGNGTGKNFKYDATKEVISDIAGVVGGQIYYLDSGTSGLTIQRMSVDSGPATTLVTGLGSPSSGDWGRMLIVGNRIYWAEGGSTAGLTGSIRSVPLTGGTPTVHVTGISNSISSMVSDGTNLYALVGGSVIRYNLSSFTSTILASNDNIAAIAIDDKAVYWTSNSSPHAVRKTAK